MSPEPIRPHDPEVAKRNVRLALALLVVALLFFGSIFVAMS